MLAIQAMLETTPALDRILNDDFIELAEKLPTLISLRRCMSEMARITRPFREVLDLRQVGL